MKKIAIESFSIHEYFESNCKQKLLTIVPSDMPEMENVLACFETQGHKYFENKLNLSRYLTRIANKLTTKAKFCW